MFEFIYFELRNKEKDFAVTVVGHRTGILIVPAWLPKKKTQVNKCRYCQLMKPAY